ncbi:hypothetical protein ACR6C2_16785 [Streptomyces sp. INA 01156]
MALMNERIEVHRAPLVEDAYGRHRDWDNYTVFWSDRAGVPTCAPGRPRRLSERRL